jgi:hypothetical protein
MQVFHVSIVSPFGVMHDCKIPSTRIHDFLYALGSSRAERIAKTDDFLQGRVVVASGGSIKFLGYV